MIRVLVADDQRINRVLLKRCLDPSRYEVLEAENGREAVERFEADRPDVVLLDVMMPEMDGFEAARHMKSRVDLDHHVPIIMVTSLTDEESLSQGMDSGADDFIPKPFNSLVLESKMKAALRTAQAFGALNKKRQELEELHEQSHREQVMAERLMANLLRTSALGDKIFKYRTEPMDVFNGDFLMAARGPRGKVRMILGDFAGHGLAAAIGGLPMAVNFERLCSSGASVFEIARSANAELRKILPRDRFMAAVILDIDPGHGVVEMLNAGMPPVLVRGVGGKIHTRIESTHLPLGILDDFEGLSNVVRLHLQAGDRLYIYSDGVIEGLDPHGNVFGEDRFEKIIEEHPDDETVFETVLSEFDGFISDAPAADDVTLMEVCPEHTERTEVKTDEGSARLHVDLNADLIREVDVMQILQGMLDGIAVFEGRRADIFAVVAELVNNAVDHGVLRLSSEMKKDVTGFAAFYEERAERLASLKDGFVRINVSTVHDGPDWRVMIEVEDSGPGFDISKVSPSGHDRAHGRGVSLVRGLCESVDWFEPGNRVMAVYRWKEERPSEDAPLEGDRA